MIKIKRAYTTRESTRKYLKKLDNWSKRLKAVTKRKFSENPDIAGFDHMLPLHNKGDIILILNVDTFTDYYPPFHLDTKKHDERRSQLYDLVGKPFSIIRRDRKNPSRPYIAINRKGIRENVMPLIIMINKEEDYEESPNHIWLPHPSGLKRYKEFLQIYPQNVSKLEKTLDKYYESLTN